MIKLFTKKVNKQLESDKIKFLHAAGSICVNQWSDFAPYITSVYRNSIVYKVGDSQSAYGDKPSKNGKSNAGQGNISTPKDDTVRVGVNLVYANMLERMYGTGAKSMDYGIKEINSKLSKIFNIRGL